MKMKIRRYKGKETTTVSQHNTKASYNTNKPTLKTQTPNKERKKERKTRYIYVKKRHFSLDEKKNLYLVKWNQTFFFFFLPFLFLWHTRRQHSHTTRNTTARHATRRGPQHLQTHPGAPSKPLKTRRPRTGLVGQDTRISLKTFRVMVKEEAGLLMRYREERKNYNHPEIM